MTTDCTNAENAGYVCDATTSSCNTVAYFRVQSGEYDTLNDIATRLFNTTSSAIASASGLSPSNASVSAGKGLYIPVTCTCSGKHSSQNVPYTILAGDTFSITAKVRYEGLATCQAVHNENPSLNATDLQIGQKVIVPIRCACPSAKQKSRGISSLVTYPVADGDNISSIIDMFHLKQQEFLIANNMSNTSVPLFVPTTVLLPFNSTPSNPPNAMSSSLSPTVTSSPADTSPSSSSSSSKVGIYVGVPVGIVALLLITALIGFFLRSKKKKKK